MTLVTKETAQRRLDQIIASLPAYAKEFGYVDYDDRVSDDQLKGVFSGDSSDRDAGFESLDEFYYEAVDFGIRHFIDEDLASDDAALLDEFDLLIGGDGSLFQRLQEIDNSDVVGSLVGNTHRKPFRLNTGHTVAATGYSPDDETAEQVQLLTDHLVSLGMTADAAATAAAELVGETLYYNTEVLVVWYGEVADLFDSVRDAHFGNIDPTFTFTWEPTTGYQDRSNGAQIVLWDGGSGAGHDVKAGPGLTVTANILDDLMLDGARGWSWTGDCAGIYLPAIMADVTLTPPAS